MTASQQIAHPAGSHWRRWGPAPARAGTLFNDQFKGDWEGYLTAIEKATPTVEVIGVTDYFSIGCYRAVKHRWQNGRLSGVKLLFPNVEMRSTWRPTRSDRSICTYSSPRKTWTTRTMLNESWRNCHSSTRDATTTAPQPIFRRWGRLTTRPSSSESALSEGANQFKTTLDKLGPFSGRIRGSVGIASWPSPQAQTTGHPD